MRTSHEAIDGESGSQRRSRQAAPEVGLYVRLTPSAGVNVLCDVGHQSAARGLKEVHHRQIVFSVESAFRPTVHIWSPETGQSPPYRNEQVHFVVDEQALRHVVESRTGTLYDGINIPARSVSDRYIASTGGAIKDLLWQRGRRDEIHAFNLVTSLLSHIGHCYAVVTESIPQSATLTPSQVKETQQFLRATSAVGQDLGTIAARFNLSPQAFGRAFRRSVGLSPFQWLRAQRIEQAKTALLRSTLTLSEIALRCGFADQSHFTRSFTAASGMPPGLWRRTHRGQ